MTTATAPTTAPAATFESLPIYRADAGGYPAVSGTVYATERVRYNRATKPMTFFIESTQNDGTKRIAMHPALAPDKKFRVTSDGTTVEFDLDVQMVDGLPAVLGLAVSRDRYGDLADIGGIMRQPIDIDNAVWAYREAAAELADYGHRQVEAAMAETIAAAIEAAAQRAFDDEPLLAGNPWSTPNAHLLATTYGAAATACTQIMVETVEVEGVTVTRTDRGAVLYKTNF